MEYFNQFIDELMSEAKPDLRHCPFCGSGKVDIIYDRQSRIYEILCKMCLGTMISSDKDHAVEKWNKRK